MSEQRKKLRLMCGVAVVLLVVCFFVLPPGQRLLDTLERTFGLVDFQDVSESYPFSLHVIDVGKADALCVRADGHVLVIDGGMASDGEQVVHYLQRMDVAEVNAVFNTHPDEDHIGGLAAVLEAFPCGAYYCSAIPAGLVPDTEEYRRVQEALETAAVPVHKLAAGDTLVFGNLLVEVLSSGREYASTNDSSLVLRLTYGECTCLLMGDAEEDVENDLLAGKFPLAADVLKVGHHGSATSTTEDFLQAVSPRFAVISVGEDRNHLPRTAVLSRLDACEGLYRTDTDGTVIFCSDGTDWKIYTEK